MDYHTRKTSLINDFLYSKENLLSEYELTELLLLINSTGGVTSESIKRIFAKFDDLNKLLNAPFEELLKINDFSKNKATAVKIVAACAKRAAEESLKTNKNSILQDWDLFLDFCRQNMAHSDVEELRVFLLDEDMHCFDNKIISRGTINKTVAHPREVIKLALKHNAKSIILAHNHPAGDCRPSTDDIVLTSEICSAAYNSGIRLFDHLIVTNESIFSFRNEGYLNEFISEYEV